MYTKQQFGLDLKTKLTKTRDVVKVASWAFKLFFNDGRSGEELEDGLKDILLTLDLMSGGPEFEFTYEELNQIADDLIAGKEVKI